MAMNLRELPEKLRTAAGERMRALAGAPLVRRSIDRVNAIAQRESERVGQLIAPAWQGAYAWYSKREQREKLLVRILGVVLTVIVLYNFVYLPLVGLGEGVGDSVATRQQQLIEVRTMMRSYQRFKVELSATE